MAKFKKGFNPEKLFQEEKYVRESFGQGRRKDPERGKRFEQRLAKFLEEGDSDDKE